ncbi:MAG: hypothetical protein LR011_05230 [Verrucomicrobia bacterium]|nr:hypothetical protein [Verrucomicrobiota bacterium]
MKQERVKIALVVFGSCIIAVVTVLTMDAMIAVNRMDPVPAAEAAAASAGWRGSRFYIRSVDASGGIFGSSAVVKYALSDAEDAEIRAVHLRRPIFSRHWKVESIDPR